MNQFEMCELIFKGPMLTEHYADIDLTATISHADAAVTVKGFYAGNGVYKIRFLPKTTGIYAYEVRGCISASGTVEVMTGQNHGMVVTKEQHFSYEDGTVYHPFGTTVYAFAHQEEKLVEETFRTLSENPFNKIRLCVFPKDYDYNKNEPEYYPFEKQSDGTWDVNRPCFAFWDKFEEKMCRLSRMGIQVDLILFHPYDRWGFIQLSMEDSIIYLDYLLRRFAAYPFFWWSLANEYDLCCQYKTKENFEVFEQFVAEHDPYHHLLSNHNCFAPWDFSRPNITHVCYQTKSLHHVADWYVQYKKPVMVDECCYEGNLPQLWGCITAREMVSRFWTVVVSGGYCTHGETYLNPEETEDAVVWWSKGGHLIGESPKRIAFLKEFVYSLPGFIEPVESSNARLMQISSAEAEKTLSYLPKEMAALAKSVGAMNTVEKEGFLAGEYVASGKVEDMVYLTYINNYCPIQYPIHLPQEHSYTIEVIDIWEMTRNKVLTNVNGNVMVPLPGKQQVVIVAFAQ